jgi:hypothetical protein
MRSRWLVTAAGLCGVVAAPILAWSCILATIPFTYDTLALVLAASVVVALITECWGSYPPDLRWSPWLWVSACVAAVVALLVGLVVDRRGFSIPLALFALLMLLAIVGVFYLWAFGQVG